MQFSIIEPSNSWSAKSSILEEIISIKLKYKMAVSKSIVFLAVFGLAITFVLAEELVQVQVEDQDQQTEDLEGSEFLLEKLIHKLVYKHEKKAYKHGGYGHGGYGSYGGGYGGSYGGYGQSYGGYYAPSYGGYGSHGYGGGAHYYRR